MQGDGHEEALMEVDKVRSLYASLPGLTLTDKILVAHAADFAPGDTQAKPGKDNR